MGWGLGARISTQMCLNRTALLGPIVLLAAEEETNDPPGFGKSTPYSHSGLRYDEVATEAPSPGELG